MGQPAEPRPTRIVVAIVDGTARWIVLDQGDAIAPRPVWSKGTELRCALVGISMMLLGGDRVHVDVDVGPGVTLELIEPAAVVAHRAEGHPSSYSTHVRVGDGATLVYNGAPLIVADGSDVTRELTVALGSGSRLLTRETIVLGRAGERGGRIDTHLSVCEDEGELLVERLALGTSTSGLPGIMSGDRIIDIVVALGWFPADVPGVPDDFVLRPFAPGAVVRAFEGSGSEQAIACLAFEAWRIELRDPSQSAEIASRIAQGQIGAIAHPAQTLPYYGVAN